MRITILWTMSALFAASNVLAQPTPTMQFKLTSTGGASCCEWISAEGRITERTPDDFTAFLKQWNSDLQGHGEVVYLNSPGGNLVAGMQLGELFRKGKFATTVGATIPMAADPTRASETKPGLCMSACAYAFLGGINRTAKPNELGFHQFYTPPAADAALTTPHTGDESSAAQMLVGLVAIYLKEMDIDPEVLFLASSTSSTEIYLPDAPTMARLRITNVHEKDEFNGWAIEPYRGGAVVTGTVSDSSNKKTQMTLFCRRSSPGQVFLLGSWSYLTPVQNKAAEETASVQGAVWGSKLKLGTTTAREQKGLDGIADLHVDNAGRFYLTYALTSQEYVQALQQGMVVEVDVPHSYGWLFRFEPPLAGLKERMAIAFKACL